MAVHSGDILMPWEHFVCSMCFRENPYAVWLIKQQCSKPELHESDLARVVVSEKSAVLEEIRSMPRGPIRGEFAKCQHYQNQHCQYKERCTFAYTSAELVTWNIKIKFTRSKPTCIFS